MNGGMRNGGKSGEFTYFAGPPSCRPPPSRSDSHRASLTPHRCSSPTACLHGRYLSHQLRVFSPLSPFRMNLAGASLCRCDLANSCDLLHNPFHSPNCRLNSRERAFRHTAVCLLLSKLLRRTSPTSLVNLSRIQTIGL